MQTGDSNCACKRCSVPCMALPSSDLHGSVVLSRDDAVGGRAEVKAQEEVDE